MLEPKRIDFNTENGRHLACYEWGDQKSAHTIICVHGLTRNGRDFDYLAERLSKNYHVLCPDIPGRGQSRWLQDPTGYNNPAYIADVVFMLNSMGIKRVHWIGTSMGGIMGMMVTNSNPGLIDALVLNDIGCLIPAAGLARIRDIADFANSYDNYGEAEAAFRKRCENFGIDDEAQWQHLLKYGIEMRNDKFSFTYDPAIFSSGFSKDTPLADVNLWPLWEAITKIPVLLIRGADSDILSHETALEMKSPHPKLELHEIIGTGHAPALMDDKQIALVQQWTSAIDN